MKYFTSIILLLVSFGISAASASLTGGKTERVGGICVKGVCTSTLLQHVVPTAGAGEHWLIAVEIDNNVNEVITFTACPIFDLSLLATEAGAGDCWNNKEPTTAFGDNPVYTIFIDDDNNVSIWIEAEVDGENLILEYGQSPYKYISTPDNEFFGITLP